jgi:3-oxoacyl-[acyl-carrier-protein] synthase-1
MKAIHITGLGAFTSVGVNVPQTMGSVLSRLQWFDDLELLDATGEPVTGARVRLRGVKDPAERYVGMGALALAECCGVGRDRRSSREQSPLFLATSPERDLPCSPKELLERLVASLDQEGADAISRHGSRVFAEGRLGSIRALFAAVNALRSNEFEACYVGGVDSLLDPVLLHELLADGRLHDKAGSDGFTPGEGAAFVKIEMSSSSQQGGMLLGVSLAEDEETPGMALADAATGALRAARLGASQLTAIVHDGTGESTAAEERAIALTRLGFTGPPPDGFATWAPSFSVGETGAAAAPLSLAMTTFFLRAGVFQGPVLNWFKAEGPMRAAIVMGTRSPVEGRRG